MRRSRGRSCPGRDGTQSPPQVNPLQYQLLKIRHLGGSLNPNTSQALQHWLIKHRVAPNTAKGCKKITRRRLLQCSLLTSFHPDGRTTAPAPLRDRDVEGQPTAKAAATCAALCATQEVAAVLTQSHHAAQQRGLPPHFDLVAFFVLKRSGTLMFTFKVLQDMGRSSTLFNPAFCRCPLLEFLVLL